MKLSQIIVRRIKCPKLLFIYPFYQTPTAVGFSTAADSTNQSTPITKPSSLSARMSFIFDQIDEIERKRDEKDETLHRIRAWRESKKQQQAPVLEAPAEELKAELAKSESLFSNNDAKEVELVHPWPEWVELMERLVQQNYFDHRRKDEDGMMKGLGLDLPEVSAEKENKLLDFTRDFKTVQTAVVNFGRDRFDILRSLSRHDLQILVGYGCPSADKKVSYSGKLLRKHVHLDEGDVCSSCSLRSSCEKAYLLTTKEDEARTIDVMRILLAYGRGAVDGSVANETLSKNKSVKAVVRKLIHEVVKLSSVPIDPNLPPPVVKRPPPKIKQPPPPPKRRVGRSDVEMKKGDWLCPKCEFLNFAKNTVCLQCDAKRPKRQLLPGEWECPQCNFLNYRRNTACFHCEHKRPPDTYAETRPIERMPFGARPKTSPTPNRRDDVSNAWNFDFDDDESDGADVAAFEYADSQKIDEDFQLSSRAQKAFDREYSDPGRPGSGFNDFDDENDDDDLDGYEVVSPKGVHQSERRIDISELEADSDDDMAVHKDWKSSHVSSPSARRGERLPLSFDDDLSDDDDADDLSDGDALRSTKRRSGRGGSSTRRGERRPLNFDDDDDDGDDLSDGETLRSAKIRSGRGGSNGMNNRRGRSGFRGKSFSEEDLDDDDDDLSDDETLNSTKRRSGRGGSNGMNNRRGGKSGFRGKSSSVEDSDDEPSYRRNNRMYKAGPGRGGKGFGKNSWRKDFDSGPRRKDREGGGENLFDRRSKNGNPSRKFRSRGGHGERGGGSGYRPDSYLDEERHHRPRVNVR